MNNNHWTLLTNIDPYQSTIDIPTDDSVETKKNWFIYDSLNNINNAIVAKPIMQFLYPEKTSHHLSMVQVVEQDGSNDCGLFAIAYAYDLSRYKDPSNLKYDQEFMRKSFNMLVKINYLPDFQSIMVPNRQRMLNKIII